MIDRSPSHLLLDVGGVGYEIEISLITFAELTGSEGAVSVHTHLVVRDDAHLLYGFSSLGEREMFRTLIKINGVGPRMALGILSGLDLESLARAVIGNDVKVLTALPGVGKKTAERLIVEMRDKVDSFEVSGSKNLRTMKSTVLEDAESALIALGYRPQEAAHAISRVAASEEDKVESLIRQALKLLI